MKECIFCRIATDSNSDLVKSTTNLVAFKDINPKAPVHLLIVPKRHIEKPDQLSADELTAMMALTKVLAAEFNVKDSGYRLLFNVGKHAGQKVDHVHLHLIGGRVLTDQT